VINNYKFVLKFKVYFVIVRISTVFSEFEQKLIEEVVRQPDGGPRCLESGGEAEVLVAVAENGGDVFAGQLGGFLEISVYLLIEENDVKTVLKLVE
jgi:hypothetical protein